MTDPKKSIGARWIIPVASPPLRDAAMVIAGGLIREIVPDGRGSADVDAGDVAILPRLVNAHTHLEFSHLPSPIGQPGIAITDWIPQVIAHRRAMGPGSDVHQAVLQGIDECWNTGTGAIGEIATSPWFLKTRARVDCQIAWFLERLGNRPADVDDRMDEARTWLDAFSNGSGAARSGFVAGLSPHSPYSTHDGLFEQLVELAVHRRLPLAMHLAETKEELQWLTDSDGPFAAMLESLGALPDHPQWRRPMDYLQLLARAHRCLVIHGNYLAPNELDFIGQNRNRMHLVYCPRTHEFFGHERWPLPEVLQRGINVAVGTDSRASNPDLNLWSELRTITRLFPDVPGSTILEMGTVGGARALGLEDRMGTLQPGRRAMYWTMPAGDTDSDEWVDRLLGR